MEAMKLIDKDALVAEIDRQIELLKPFLGACAGQIVAEATNKLSVLEELKNFLDTLEVKEVDLENELKEDWLFADKTEVDCLECMCLTEDMFVSLAKKYFKLGLKAQKGEEI